jgi:hypothetical protein
MQVTVNATTSDKQCLILIWRYNTAQMVKTMASARMDDVSYCTVRTDHDMTRGRPCIVSILKDGSAQRKAVMTRTVPQSCECLPVSNLRSPLRPLGIRSGLPGGAWHLLAFGSEMGI